VHLGLPRAFPRDFLDAFQILALTLGGLNALLNRLRHLRVFMQVVVEVDFEEVADEGAQRFAIRGDGVGAELGFGLGFKHRLDDAHTYRRLNPGADVRRLVLFFVKAADHLHQLLAKRRQMRAPLGRVLAVDKGVIFLTALGTVGEGDFYVVAHQVNRRIERLVFHLLAQQI